jgi:hypothetical protein
VGFRDPRKSSHCILRTASEQPQILIELGQLDDNPPIADPDMRDSTGSDLVVNERF